MRYAKIGEFNKNIFSSINIEKIYVSYGFNKKIRLVNKRNFSAEFRRVQSLLQTKGDIIFPRYLFIFSCNISQPYAKTKAEHDTRKRINIKTITTKAAYTYTTHTQPKYEKIIFHPQRTHRLLGTGNKLTVPRRKIYTFSIKIHATFSFHFPRSNIAIARGKYKHFICDEIPTFLICMYNVFDSVSATFAKASGFLLATDPN